MGKQVTIEVTGIQMGTADEAITTKSEGTMLYKEPYYYVAYEEQLDPESGQKCKTTLRFDKTTLRVTRKGEVVSALEFEKGKIHKSLYMTPFGNFDISLKTKDLIIEQKEKSANIFADYRIGLNEMPPTKGRLEIHIINNE